MSILILLSLHITIWGLLLLSYIRRFNFISSSEFFIAIFDTIIVLDLLIAAMFFISIMYAFLVCIFNQRD